MPKFKFALFLPVLLWMTAGSFNVSGQNASSDLTGFQRSAYDIFKELVEINTTHSKGSTKAAEAMYERLLAAGFSDGDVKIVGPGPEHMNLVVRYRGTGKLKPILFIGHLDVVEALRRDWTVDPFSFGEADGYFYGRGTTDMKEDDAVLIACLIRLRQERFVPDRDIIVALTEGEEGGDANGVNWLLVNRRDLINAEYCVNPDGGGGNIKNGKPGVMNIQTSEKVYVDLKFETHYNGGHSSLPGNDNAIYELCRALDKLSGYDFPIRLNETSRLFFERNALNETGRLQSDMIAAGRIPPDTSAAERLARSSPYYNSMMRTTCVATLLDGGHANNALPQTAEANINCRLLPDDNPENVLSTLKSVINDPQVGITISEASIISPVSPLRNDVLAVLDSITASMWPGVIVTPLMSAGATDGRYLRKAGIAVYGISGMFKDVDDVRAHGRDERIGSKEFYKGLEFMYRFIRALSGIS
ncbi:MAG: M20/M25/M40 family metallo-hydrolase [Bacteroidales bacterium]